MDCSDFLSPWPKVYPIDVKIDPSGPTSDKTKAPCYATKYKAPDVAQFTGAANGTGLLRLTAVEQHRLRVLLLDIAARLEDTPGSTSEAFKSAQVADVQDCVPVVVTERFPTTIIEGGRRGKLNLGSLWAHRELLYFLAWRDIKVRYKQTVLGAAWAILQPLIAMVVFTILFGRLARVPSDGEPYAIFSYAGLLIWNFFTTAVTSSSNSLVASTNLITKVYFPRLLVPAAAVVAALVDIAIASTMLLALMPIYRVNYHLSLIMLVPLSLLIALTATALGIWTSALNVKYRDVRYALPFAIQMLMFVSPVIYPVTFLPERWRCVLRLNPITGIIEGVRDAVFDRAPNWSTLTIASALTVSLLLIAIFMFNRMEEEFADII